MEIVDPENLRMVPGESFHGIFSSGLDGLEEVGFFVRSATSTGFDERDINVLVRAGLIKFGDVLLVLTMIRLQRYVDEIYDVWWNYHAPDGPREFERMVDQETIGVHVFSDTGKKHSIIMDNSFRKFFRYAFRFLKRTTPWPDIEFDRAVRGFCAQSYPKEELWNSMELANSFKVLIEQKQVGIDSYPGIIPDELRPYYLYEPDQGHCIRIIPSILEGDAREGNPHHFLHAAPVKTVLRCGIRWVRGLPVAPIPYIPGYGLVAPPDDSEF